MKKVAYNRQERQKKTVMMDSVGTGIEKKEGKGRRWNGEEKES